MYAHQENTPKRTLKSTPIQTKIANVAGSV